MQLPETSRTGTAVALQRIRQSGEIYLFTINLTTLPVERSLCNGYCSIAPIDMPCG